MAMQLNQDQWELIYEQEKAKVEIDRKRNDMEAERLHLARCEIMAKTPGVMVDEIREALGLSPHPDEDIGSLSLFIKSDEKALDLQ